MEEEYMKISFTKVIDLVLNEERVKIRKFYNDMLGKATADIMDSYVYTESEIIKLLTK
jgi:predicted protein tyrosine phosphatase